MYHTSFLCRHYFLNTLMMHAILLHNGVIKDVWNGLSSWVHSIPNRCQLVIIADTHWPLPGWEMTWSRSFNLVDAAISGTTASKPLECDASPSSATWLHPEPGCNIDDILQYISNVINCTSNQANACSSPLGGQKVTVK